MVNNFQNRLEKILLGKIYTSCQVKMKTFLSLWLLHWGVLLINYVSEILGTHKGNTCNIEKPHLVFYFFFFANKLSVKRFTSNVAVYLLNWAG